jgi:hypothetical protein
MRSLNPRGFATIQAVKTDAAPIALTKLMRITATGERIPLAVEIGQPMQGDGCWRTPAAIHGLDGRLPDICGEDSLQSLCLALELVRRRLKSIVEGGERLTDSEGQGGEEVDFNLDSYFPRVD